MNGLISVMAKEKANGSVTSCRMWKSRAHAHGVPLAEESGVPSVPLKVVHVSKVSLLHVLGPISC